MTDSSVNVQSVGLGMNLGTSAPTFDVTSGGSLILSGVLSGSGASITKAGTGNLTLSNFNTYTGGTTVNAGTLTLTVGSTAGAVRGTLTINSGATVSSTANDSFGYQNGQKVDTINIVGGTLTHNSAGNITLASAVVNMTGGTLQSTGGNGIDLYNNGSGNTVINTLASATTATIAGKLNLRAGDNNATGTVFTVDDGAAATDLTVSAVISDGGNGANSIVQKSGLGTMLLTGINTYTGGTVVNAGTLTLNTTGNAGAIRGTLTINSGATVSSIAHDSFGYDNGVKVNTINIVGGTLTQTDNTNLTLSSATVNMTGGTLQSTGGTSSGIDLFNNGSGNTVINTLASATTATIAGQLNLRAGNNNATGTVFTVADGAAATDLTVSAVLTDGPNGGIASAVQKSGLGTMLLTGTNTYTGGTTVNAGTLTLGTGGGIGAIRGTVTINSGATLSSIVSDSFGYNTGGVKVDIVNINGGTLTHSATNGNLTLSSLVVNMTGGTLQSTGTGGANGLDFYDNGSSLTTNTAINTLASPNTAIINGQLNLRAGDGDTTGTVFTVARGTAPTDLTVNAIIVNGSAQGAASIVQKSGAGIMSMTGTNTYTGGTMVNAGTLVVSGSIATSATTVASGATLSLSGSGTAGAVTVNSGTFQMGTAGTAAAVTINGGTFAGIGTVNSLTFTGASIFGPGNSPGTVTIANGGTFTLSTGTTSTFEFTDGAFGAGTFDLVTTPGTASGTIAGTLNLNFSGSNYAAGTNVTFINLTSIAGTFSTINVNGLTSGLLATVNYNNALGDVSIALTTAIPEPSTYAAFAGALALIGTVVYRRRRQS